MKNRTKPAAILLSWALILSSLPLPVFAQQVIAPKVAPAGVLALPPVMVPMNAGGTATGLGTGLASPLVTTRANLLALPPAPNRLNLTAPAVLPQVKTTQAAVVPGQTAVAAQASIFHRAAGALARNLNFTGIFDGFNSPKTSADLSIDLDDAPAVPAQIPEASEQIEETGGAVIAGYSSSKRSTPRD